MDIIAHIFSNWGVIITRLNVIIGDYLFRYLLTLYIPIKAMTKQEGFIGMLQKYMSYFFCSRQLIQTKKNVFFGA